MAYVYCTASNSTTYCDYGVQTEADKNRGYNIARKKIHINGGHNVARPVRGGGLGAIHTPRGVVTEVSDEDLEILLQNKSFQRHMEAGFITIDKKKVDPEKRAADMAPADGSAPITPADFVKGKYSEEGAPIYKKKSHEEIREEVMIAPSKQKSKGKR
jgi:hypothetical protein